MDIADTLISNLVALIPLLATIAIVLTALGALRWILNRRWKHDPDARFRFQLIMLAMSFAGFISIVVALPISSSLRGQLLSLIGILLSAAIALSSTTFIGNVMAGIMLKAIRSARPGDFITVSELTGRITEMGLLHTEIQTEFRDLVTVPNLFMVTNPIKVVRASGTILTEEVSLGFDVPQNDVQRVLNKAAAHAGLTDTFVQVRKLGDFSVTYRVAGLLNDVKSLISARSALRGAMLDALHRSGIEIVSPTFMNSRAVAGDQRFIPKPSRKAAPKQQKQAEEVAFDKAESASEIEEFRQKIELVDAEISKLNDGDAPAETKDLDELQLRREELLTQLSDAEDRRQQALLAEKSGESAKT